MRLRKLALAALSLATAVGASAIAPASADAAPEINVKATKHVRLGEKVKVKAGKTVRFKPSPNLKQSV